MEKSPQDSRPPTNQPNGESRTAPRRAPNLWLLLIVLMVLLVVLFSTQREDQALIRYDFFLEQIEARNVARVSIGEQEASGAFRERPALPPAVNERGELEVPEPEAEPELAEREFRVMLPRDGEARSRLVDMLRDSGAQFEFQRATTDNLVMMLWMVAILLPLGLLLFFWLSYRRTRDQMMGGGFLSGFSKSPAKRYEATQQPVTFKDVAGIEGVKADLMEIVEYLKSPEKFQRLGGRVPKGVLLNGAPGTGKTLLARAVAGEAGVPYYSVSGSEFIQMFVGVGASRVRDLFKTAKENAPAIIFVDEIDAVGRQRGAGLGGGHDEREQTLNQILSEMDGFSQNDSVIVLAATNRIDVLDPALLRPGRFDRHITVPRPTLRGRIEIFKVHTRGVPVADDVDLERLAQSTVGLTGADIRNIVNEAALWAARQNKSTVDMGDFDHARDKVLMGAKREEVLQEDEKEKTAYHEAGHTLLSWGLAGADRVHKVTIIPRGRALGATQIMPAEDRMNVSEKELRDQLIVLLGGRAAEQLIYRETTVGAESDLERATKLARRMITHWGMSELLGPVSYKLSDDDPFLGRELHQQRQFSEHTMEVIDGEVAQLLHGASEQACRYLEQHQEQLDALARALLEKEELTETEIAELIGPSIHAQLRSNGSPRRGRAREPNRSDGFAPRAGRGEAADGQGQEEQKKADTD